MKKILVFALFVFAAESQVFAQPLSCVGQAQSQTSLGADASLALCCRHNNLAPVDCYVRAMNETALGSSDALNLCTCAANSHPVDCVNSTTSQTSLDTNNVLGICAAQPQPVPYPGPK